MRNKDFPFSCERAHVTLGEFASVLNLCSGKRAVIWFEWALGGEKRRGMKLWCNERRRFPDSTFHLSPCLLHFNHRGRRPLTSESPHPIPCSTFSLSRLTTPLKPPSPFPDSLENYWSEKCNQYTFLDMKVLVHLWMRLDCFFFLRSHWYW